MQNNPSAIQFRQMRRHMVESQLRTSDVNDPGVLGAMMRVPRENYVPKERASTAYMDRTIPIAPERSLNPPVTTGRMIVEADIEKTDTVLVIGAANGYVADIISGLAATVVAVEEVSSLVADARTALAGHDNVTIVEGPLGEGSAAQAPFDVIFIDGAVETVPASLARQLHPQGRLITAVNDRGVTRLARGVRVGDHVSLTPFADMEAVSLPGFTKPKIFTF